MWLAVGNARATRLFCRLTGTSTLSRAASSSSKAPSKSTSKSAPKSTAKTSSRATPRTSSKFTTAAASEQSSATTTKIAAKPHRKRSTSVAQELAATKIWAARPYKTKKNPDGPKKSALPKAPGDRSRVNLVSDSLCDDILKYIGPTLERHEGCDLLDINPGAGVWSQKLHEKLRPRSHILMEPDAELYKPFLDPLLSKSNTRLVPQSGILWKELAEAMNHLEYQVERPTEQGSVPQRNDTLLVTANLSFYPKRRYRNFESISILVLYQLLSSIQSSSLFQKYGLVRMLLWVNDEDKRTFLPRSLQHRKKSALQAEFACEWLAEVAGKDPASVETTPEQLKKLYNRDNWINVESTRDTLDRMKAAGLEFPSPSRRMAATADVMKNYKGKRDKHAPRTEASHIERPYMAELEALNKAAKAGQIKPKTKEAERHYRLIQQVERSERDAHEYDELNRELDEITRLYSTGSAGDREAATVREAVYNAKLSSLNRMMAIDYRLRRDNLHIYKQDPPVLLWDRRPWDPLRVDATEFFPNVECALLDIQPKAMHSLLRETGPGSSRAGDMFDLIQRSMLASSLEPVSNSLDKLWPGAKEGIWEHCPSLRDPKMGGLPGREHAELCARVMNERQWMEVLDGFVKWPFRPTYAELIGRLSDDLEASEPGEGQSPLESMA